jgi:flagellar protein FliO/FliZ
MFESLFGAEMPLAIRFFLAFLIVLGLIGATAWAVRRFGSGRLGGAGARGRQPRLAVIDHASVDARRRLILVRRDNIEHLLMIGGPTDVVVEANIVRGAPATREVTMPRPPALPEALPRAIPLPDSGANGSWPLQPEPMAPARAAPRIEPLPEEPAAPPHAEPPRPQRETLAALADEIATRPVPPPRGRPGVAARSRPIEPRVEPRAEPRMPAAKPAEAEPLAADQSLAEMAHRLEAALRKPKSAAPPAPAARAMPAPPPADAEAPPPPPAAQPRPAPGKPSQGKALYDSLEQEMASLLGRPAGKT